MECEDCKKRFRATCSELGNEAFEKKIESEIDTWYCADSYFDTQCNFEQSNKFDPLVKDMNKAYSAPSTNKTTSLNGLKFVSLNINGIRGKKLELLAFLDYHKPDSVAIQETKIDSSISASELFHDSCPYNAYRKDRNLHGDAPYSQGNSHRPWTELENDSESVWAKVFANKTSH